MTDLKRWIGDTGANRQRMVSDRKGNFVKFEIERLVQLFLLRLIEKAEAVLREYRIRSIGLSYPAKFGPQRRQAWSGSSEACASSATWKVQGSSSLQVASTSMRPTPLQSAASSIPRFESAS